MIICNFSESVFAPDLWFDSSPFPGLFTNVPFLKLKLVLQMAH